MNEFLAIFAPMVIVLAGGSISSLKIINSGNEALVERLGEFNRKLEPGLNFIVPLVEKIVVEETTREQVFDIDPQNAITEDNVSMKVDAVIYWQVLDLESAFYNVENVEEAIENLVVTVLRSEIGKMQLEETFSSRDNINQALLQQLDDATASWGVKVTRVEVSEITPSAAVMEALEQERAAKSRKNAVLQEAEGTVSSITMISEALQSKSNSTEVLQYLIAQRYVDANRRLGESANSKVVFMDPKSLNQALFDLMPQAVQIDAPKDSLGGAGNGSSGS